MSIVVRDPLELLPYLTGVITTPKEELAARGTQQLDVRQRSIAIGEPIPIVFCRRTNDNGGVWVSPGASEGRFENDNNNDLTAYYQLVLSEGDLPQLPLNDLYQGPCKVGNYVQTYNRRAGAWLPGAFIDPLDSLVDTVQFSFDAPGTANPTWYNATPVTYGFGFTRWEFNYNGNKHYYPGSLSPGPGGPVLQTRKVTAETFQLAEVPVHCGTSGTYANLTTLSFDWIYGNGDQRWDRQIHAFVREGMQVTRILDSALGSSNNVVDLALYLIRQSSRLPENMLDIAAFTTAANFTNTNSFFYNGEFKESTNLEDWLQDISTKFLLRVSDNLGKKAFRPLLPINNDYTIKTTAISAVFTFTENHILPNGFQISYIPLSERKPICALMLWRQQPDSDVGIVRSSEIRFTGEAATGPYEQYDLSQFCTTENHAIKVGAYYVARRKYITHTLRIRVRPDVFNSTLILGDIVRVRLQRETDVDIIDYHDYYYQVERINKSITGVIELDLMHFPVDDQNRSLLALAVVEATGTGYSLPTGRNDFSCNVNNDADAIGDVGGNLDLPASGNFQTNLTAGSEGNPNQAINNPGYIPNYGQITGGTGPEDEPVDGDTLTAGGVCPGGYIEWYRCPKDAGVFSAGAIPPTCEKVLEGSEEFDYTVTTADIDYEIVGIGRCPDPSTPSGYGDAFVIDTSKPVEPDILSYEYVRWTGDLIYEGVATNYTSSWTNLSGFNSSDYLTIGALSNCSFISNVGFIAPNTDSRFSSVPAIGPVAWRAEVSVTTSGNGPLVGEVALGGLGSNGNALNTCAVIGPSVKFVIFSSSPKTYSVSGVWEFSNDASTVLVDWEGRTA